MNATRQFSALFVGAAIALAAAPATAQTVGEILDKGGQKLDAAAARALIATGVTFSGRNAAGFVGTTVYKADGTLTSSGTRERDNFTNTGTGTWAVEDSGKVCTKIQWAGGQGTGGGCYFLFKQGEDYYTAQTDSRDQAALKRPIPK